MKRPDIALTGIDRKLSAEVTANFELTAMASLIEIRVCRHAPVFLRVWLIAAVLIFAVGVYLPGISWLVALLLSACVAAGGWVGSSRMKRRAAFLQSRLAERVRDEYGAELVAVRKHDVHVTASRNLLAPR